MVLLVKTNPFYSDSVYNPGVWGFPKGRVAASDSKPSESINNGNNGKSQVIDQIELLMNCAVREFYEETGLHVTLTRDYRRIRLGTTKFFIVWVNEPWDVCYSNVTDKDEVADVTWVSIDCLRKGEHRMNHGLREFLSKKESYILRQPIVSVVNVDVNSGSGSGSGSGISGVDVSGVDVSGVDVSVTPTL
jgi:8-oxo-dGTP pyrophosphatase MutT (NUDIX family)